MTSSRLFAIALLCLSGQVFSLEPAPCVTTLEGLKLLADDPSFPLRWEEASMSDGKPLVVSIMEKHGTLFLEFMKTREGLWAEGEAVICRGSADLEARIGQTRMGPAAHWILRQSVGQARSFTLSRHTSGHLQIATLGWSGTFFAK